MTRSKASRSKVTALRMDGVIDSRRLLYFYHVAKAGRFTAAEAVLDVVQSAMSRQIQQLENDLGVELLKRTGHGVQLTKFGQILYRKAEDILKSMAATIDEIDSARNLPLGSVRLAVPPSFMLYMPTVIRDFAAANRGVQIRILEATFGAAYDLLANNEADLAIVLQSANSPRLVLRELVNDELFVVSAPGHPVLRSKYVSRSALGEAEFALPATHHGLWAILKEYLAEEEIVLRSPVEADSLILIKELLQKMPLCSILPRIACQAELRAGTLLARPLRPSLSRKLYIAHLKDQAPSGAVRSLIDCLVTTTQKWPHR